MALALEQARLAHARDEVPVGALLVVGEQVLAATHNRVRERGDARQHAEMLALDQALVAHGHGRLEGATLYCTLEPCFMCAGALSHARIARVVFALRDPKFGALASLGAVLTDPRHNHRALLTEGVGREASRSLLQSFFRTKRAG